MKTEMTTQQAIVMYTVIEALREQFDRENLGLLKKLQVKPDADCPQIKNEGNNDE